MHHHSPAHRRPHHDARGDTTGHASHAQPGRRRAGRTSRTRRLLPSVPVVGGLAALVLALGGAASTATAGPGRVPQTDQSIVHASALTGTSAVASVSTRSDRQPVSRTAQREALEQAADEKLHSKVKAQAEQRKAALRRLARKAEQQAAEVARSRWTLPVSGYHLTATFGAGGSLWASDHTGLDFATAYGSPIVAVSGGTITFAGYDGAYGNKVVITLDNGTELWFAHMSAIAVSVGEEVEQGELIGYVGATGNTTGPHLHLEVRPGGGDPVDPYAALSVHGATP